MTKLNDAVGLVLRSKGEVVFSLPAGASALDALRLMNAENIGAVVVLSEGRPIGVFSERDCLRDVVAAGLPVETRLQDAVTGPSVAVTPRTTVDACMRMMTSRRLRHLLVMEQGELRGLISIGDLVKWIIASQELAIRQLEDFITGRYPA